MIVTFHHSQAYDWEVVAQQDVRPGDVLATNLAGDLTRRISVDSAWTRVVFAPDTIELTQAERDAAGLVKKSDKSIIARCLEDGAATRFDPTSLTDISLDPVDETLRIYLLDHFGVALEESP